jgi:hypothetical protein
VVPADYEAVLREGVRVQGRVVRPLEVRARFVWTGSWTTVVVSVDLENHRPLSEWAGLREAFEHALEARKLAGHDVRVEDTRYAPLHLSLLVFVARDQFARQVRAEVLRRLSGPALPGTLPFFAAGRFTFGQPLFLSDLYGGIASVPGVESVEVTRFKRLGDRYSDREAVGAIQVDPLEIIRCDNDPAHPEYGMVSVRTCGGKEG